MESSSEYDYDDDGDSTTITITKLIKTTTSKSSAPLINTSAMTFYVIYGVTCAFIGVFFVFISIMIANRVYLNMTKKSRRRRLMQMHAGSSSNDSNDNIFTISTSSSSSHNANGNQPGINDYPPKYNEIMRMDPIISRHNISNVNTNNNNASNINNLPTYSQFIVKQTLLD